MSRLTDERLAEIRAYIVTGYSTLRERAIVATLLAEVDRTRGFEAENDDLWTDFGLLQDELLYWQNQ